MSKPLPSRPRADTITIEDLVAWVDEGRIRIPDFQRPLRWRGTHVRELFDSIWQGYPVGDLLFWQRPAEPAQLALGPLRIEAPYREDAWWVVDGQQRLTALACTLLHPRPSTASNDIFALWFDLRQQEFTRPASAEPAPDHWIPLNQVLDAVRLGEWWSQNHGQGGMPELYRVALQLGRRVRETRLPVYIVETRDPDALKIIFSRLNGSGVRMRETEVFSALHAVEGERGPLERLSAVTHEAGMGALEDQWLLRCLRAVTGERLDTRPRRELGAYRDQVETAALALGAALDFLRLEGHFSHLRLLPYRLPLVALTRFFALHPDPSARARILLRRWLWRGIVNRRHRDTNNPQLRWLTDAITADQPTSVAEMLRNVGEVGADEISAVAQEVAHAGRTFSAAETRIHAALLAHAGPRDVESGELLDVGALFDQSGPEALRRVASDRSDRILHPYLDDPSLALDRASPEVQRSHHWVSSKSGEASRRAALELYFRELLLVWCEPGMPDFVSLTADLDALGEE